MKHFATLLGVIVTLAIAMPGLSLAQENDKKPKDGIFESREQYNQFMRRVRELDDPEVKKAIPAFEEIIRASHGLSKQPFGSPFHTEKSWMLRLLDNKGVRAEIEMVDYQFADIKRKSKDVNERMTGMISQLVAKGDALDAEEIRESVTALRDMIELEIDQTLLPEQQERLRQILIHGRLLREPLIRVVTSEPVASELDLSNSQKRMLKDEWKQIQEKLNQDIADLKAKARKELGTKLPNDKRRRYDELFGENFQFQDQRQR